MFVRGREDGLASCVAFSQSNFNQKKKKPSQKNKNEGSQPAISINQKTDYFLWIDWHETGG
jgi:hypothetical protein